MDPVTHSLTGAALSRAGLKRATPLATATLVLAANAPDLDGLIYVTGSSYGALAFRRGITHGPLALVVLPLIVAGLILMYDRYWRQRRHPQSAPARAGPVLGLALLGVVTHSPLDWMNTYGIRLLMPFSERWFYGDSLFIIDPWIWLVLAAPFAVYAAGRRAQRLWILLGILSTALVMAAPQVPIAARVLWSCGVAAVVAGALLAQRRGTAPGTGGARVALVTAAVYIALMVVAGRAARTVVAGEAAGRGLSVDDLMVAPAAANPLAADVVVADSNAYHAGTFNWLDRPRVTWDPEPLPMGERDATVLATLQLQQVRDYLRWSRFPFVRVRADGDGHEVRFGDARYPSSSGVRGALGGITVRVDGMSARQVDGQE